MDPVTLISQALLTGAAESMKETASSAIRDAYHFLRALLLQRLQGDAKGILVLDEYEKDPKVWEKPFESTIREKRIDMDQEILAAARALLNLHEPVSRKATKFNIEVKGGNVQMVTGDGTTVTMVFNENLKQKSRRSKRE